MDCIFSCSAPQAKPAPALSARDNNPLEDLTALSTNAILITGTDIHADYVHGWCNFRMQLKQQCVNKPNEGWHNEMLNYLPNIYDPEGKVVISFPQNDTRIDWPNKRRYRGFGQDGLQMVWQNGQVYYDFDGGRWDTTTKDDGMQYGKCTWLPWTRGEWGCEERLKGASRESWVGCVFKC